MHFLLDICASSTGKKIAERETNVFPYPGLILIVPEQGRGSWKVEAVELRPYEVHSTAYRIGAPEIVTVWVTKATPMIRMDKEDAVEEQTPKGRPPGVTIKVEGGPEAVLYTPGGQDSVIAFLGDAFERCRGGLQDDDPIVVWYRTSEGIGGASRDWVRPGQLLLKHTEDGAVSFETVSEQEFERRYHGDDAEWR